MDNANGELAVDLPDLIGTHDNSLLDLKFLKLWTPIVKHLSDEEDEVRMRACWVCGTAVQVRDNILLKIVR